MNNIQNNSESVIIASDPQPEKSIIWLHGLGADGHDFVPIASELQLPPEFKVRFIFPHAPVKPVTINNGEHMRAWFDIVSLTDESLIDKTGIKTSQQLVTRLIEQEITEGISSDNIVIAGFSQGAVMALITGLCYEKPLAGVLALSGFLPMAAEVFQEASSMNRTIPIFLAHGTEDPLVLFQYGKITQLALQAAGYNVSWHTYAMPHTVSSEEIADIRKWILSIWINR